jgi:hypothetical protein
MHVPKRATSLAIPVVVSFAKLEGYIVRDKKMQVL